MQTNFAAALALVLKSEGGFVDDPRDPGGATNFGVTQAVYDGFRPHARRSVRLIEQTEVAAIYRRQYWDAVRGDDLPAGLDHAVFDAAVNSGVVQAVKWLQTALPVSPIDGRIGQGTLRAVAGCSDNKAVIRRLCARRLGFLQCLKNWAHFGKGWGNRVRAVQAAALAMSDQAAPRV